MSLAGTLQRFLDQYGVEYHSGKRAFVTSCLSPSCGKEDHCYIWKSDGGAICFRCGKKWRLRWVIAAIARCPAEQSYSIFFGNGAGDEILKELDPKMFEPVDVEDPGSKSEPEVYLGPDFPPVYCSERGLLYLVKRGIEDEQSVHDFDLRYHAMMDAVVFPIKKDGAVYGWQARRIDPKDGELRMISHVFAKSKFLLNWDHARKYQKVVLVEGPFDCLHVDLKGYGYAGVASLGKGVSRDQIKLILDMPAKEIFIGLDPDAFEEVYEVVGRLGLGKKLFRVKPPEHRKDFGECTEEETLNALLTSQQVSGPSDFFELFFK